MRTRAVPVGPLAAQWTLLGSLLWVVLRTRETSGGAALVAAAVGMSCAAGGWFLLAQALARHGRQGLGPADHVTVTRGTLACVVAAITTRSVLDPVAPGTSGSAAGGALVLVAAVALALDAVDGWVARRTGTSSSLGARFDMEVDAFLILVLSLAAARVLGGWVLVIGLFRYVLMVGARVAPWLGGPVPPRLWRKAVAALQGVALTLATAEVLPRPLAGAVVGLALLLLAWSFGTQGLQLWWARTPPDRKAQPAGAAPPTTARLASGPGRKARAVP